MSYPMIFLAVLAACAIVGCILLAVFAWGEYNDNPFPADEDDSLTQDPKA